MANNSILGEYFIPEIEFIILQYLDPIQDYKNLSFVNWFYYDVITNMPIFYELKSYFHYIYKQDKTFRLFLRLDPDDLFDNREQYNDNCLNATKEIIKNTEK